MHQAGLVPAFSVMMACTAAKHRIKTAIKTLNTILQERQVHLPSSSLSFLLSDTVAESGDPTFGSIRRVLFIRR